MHSNKTTNLSVIIQNLITHSDDLREKVVLIKTGSLNPIHRGHISNLVRVKEYLEREQNLHVVGGYISATHDHLVRRKLGGNLIPGHHRIQMCRLAIQEAEQTHWLDVDEAEVKISSFVSPSNILLSLQNYINTNISFGPKIRVIYVVGLDHFIRGNGMRSLRRHPWGGVAVVYRSGEEETQIESRSTGGESLYYIEDDLKGETTFPVSEISSTKIREFLMNGKSCHELTYSSVLAYIMHHGLRFIADT